MAYLKFRWSAYVQRYCLLFFVGILGIFSTITINAEILTQHAFGKKLENAALKRVGKTLIYDGRYQKISYPMGDVADERGVCTDVVIRSYRKLGIDLQELIHNDMRENFSVYPGRWGLTKPDSNIDHRRVPNLRRFFERHAETLDVSDDPEDYAAGDIVSWVLENNAPHIGIVLSHRSMDGKRPLIVHNIGWGTMVDDVLFQYKITGHYRYFPEADVLTE